MMTKPGWEPNLLQWWHEPLALHSGAVSNLKIECDSFTQYDWHCCAHLISTQCQFSQVIGVERGGIPLATELAGFRTFDSPNVLICDDVMTTGTSMTKLFWEAVTNGISPDHILGWVVFRRTQQAEPWINSIFSLNVSV